jgi:hypothetical protein
MEITRNMKDDDVTPISQHGPRSCICLIVVVGVSRVAPFYHGHQGGVLPMSSHALSIRGGIEGLLYQRYVEFDPT